MRKNDYSLMGQTNVRALASSSDLEAIAALLRQGFSQRPVNHEDSDDSDSDVWGDPIEE